MEIFEFLLSRIWSYLTKLWAKKSIQAACTRLLMATNIKLGKGVPEAMKSSNESYGALDYNT
jgi:hypothetical protein